MVTKGLVCGQHRLRPGLTPRPQQLPAESCPPAFSHHDLPVLLGLLRPQEGLGLHFPQPETFPVAQILIRNRATDLDARMHDGTTPLILAARLAVEGMLEDLINSHADVNAVDDLGKPAQRGPWGRAWPQLGPSQPSPLPPTQASLPCTGPPP